jgi:hypothetical protein
LISELFIREFLLDVVVPLQVRAEQKALLGVAS